MAASYEPTSARATTKRWRELSKRFDGTGRRVLVASSFTSQPIEPGLGVALAEAERHAPSIAFADYNQLFQVCLQPDLHVPPDVDDVVVIWRIEDVFERDFHAWTCDEAGALDRLADGVRSLADAVTQLASNVSAAVVVSDAPVPVGFGLDHADPSTLGRLAALQHTLNAAFDERLVQPVDHHLDRLGHAALQLHAGTAAAFDRRNWLMYRQPFTDDFALVLGHAIADVIACRTMAAPKVLVLDCDGTLWDGVAVDDGIGGLQAGDAFPGFAFRSFQLAVRRLRHQGVLLALASKNDDATVATAFRDVDGMVLTDDDISARRVSWDPKPPAVADIAGELNIGVDSVVFVDDSDYEVGAMRTQLPDVRTLQVPENIEELPDLLAETGWFRGLSVTDDDRARTERVQAESKRSVAATAMDHDEFLASLGLVVGFGRATAGDIGRVTQLINKTNQFNVTTRRRTEGEVTDLLGRDDAVVHTVTVHDRFGEYGLVGVVISVFGDATEPDAWSLDTLLMSCRVLGRGVETAMLASAVTDLRRHRPGSVVARYRESARNALVATLFPDHGFIAVDDGDGEGEGEGDSDGDRVYRLPTDTDVAVPEHITITSTGSADAP